jgi:uridine monophosphate synthetase
MHPPVAFLPQPQAQAAPVPTPDLAMDGAMRSAAAAPSGADLALELDRLGAVKFGDFKLKSGARSPVYVDLRLLVSDPAVLAQAAAAYADLIAPLDYDRLAAIPLAGLPIGTAVALHTGRPLVYPRLTVKAHGTAQSVEGSYRAGETALVIDDLISSGESKREAIAPLEAAGLVVRDVAVLIDRQGGGREDLASAGYALHSVLTLTQIVDHLHASGRVDDATREAVEAFVAAPNG